MLFVCAEHGRERTHRIQSRMSFIFMASFSLYLSAVCHFSTGIKSSKFKLAKARRPKLAGRIKELAAKDVQAAKMLAYRGRQFSEIEKILYLYYWALKEFRQSEFRINSDLKTLQKNEPIWTKEILAEYHADMGKVFEGYAAQIGQVFQDAIKGSDSKKVFEIGKAIESMKTFKSKKQDLHRVKILDLKMMLDKKGQKTTTARYVAKCLNWPDMSGADGFRQIHRMCKELNLQLSDSRCKTNKQANSTLMS